MMRLDPLKDNVSSVELIDSMGTDLTVVNAARVSMAKESDFDIETGELNDKDIKLITYLAKHQHWTPFSQPQIQLRIKMPIFVARQWFKHQIGFTRNEVSRRYVSDAPEMYLERSWRTKAESVKQGSSDEITEYNEGVILSTNKLNKALLDHYTNLIEIGVCPEQARMVLPQSMYTEFVETGSLAAYARLCKLRLDPHAQKEIRMYAEAVSEIVETLFPESWKAISRY